jgi:hypothetical protein
MAIELMRQDIVENACKRCSDVVPEAEFDGHMEFGDAESNHLAVYSLAK